MKNNASRQKPYARLIRKMFIQTLAILVAAIAIILFLRSAGRGYIGNAITECISRFYHVDWDRAVDIYHLYVRNDLDTIIMVTIVVFFVILFRFLLTSFTRYFDEIVAGVDRLAQDSPGRFSLSAELSFVEEKLLQVKDKLERRAKTAQEAEQKKNDLVVYLAHDIKTPLTSVIGYLNLLAENPDLPTAQKAKYVNITLEKAYRLENLINEFFEITRYNLAEVPLKNEAVDLSYMLVQMADEAYPQTFASGKKINIEADEALFVRGDADKLARVFNNILKNAVSYSDEGGTIKITAALQDANAVVRFQNPGAIPEDKLGSIFEKFYRLDNARSSATGGSGLGLAIARDIVTLHGGTIEATSGEGQTMFTVTLPNALSEKVNRPPDPLS